MSTSDLPILNGRPRHILEELCREHGITLELLEQLLEIQRTNLGRGRQLGIGQEFSAALSEFLDADGDEPGGLAVASR